jgi:formate hydrogenlyase transcriptional activator
MSFENHFDSEADLRRYEALLEMADLMVHHRSLPELFGDLAERLHKVTSFEFAAFSLYDPNKDVMKLLIWEGKELAPGPTVASVGDSPAGWVWKHQEPLILSDLQSDVHFLADLNLLKDKGIRSYCTLPLTTAQKRLGALGLGSSQVDAFSAKDLRLLPRVAELVAVAVENALTREAQQQEKDR